MSKEAEKDGKRYYQCEECYLFHSDKETAAIY